MRRRSVAATDAKAAHVNKVDPVESANTGGRMRFPEVSSSWQQRAKPGAEPRTR
jgi:hypothetical protein